MIRRLAGWWRGRPASKVLLLRNVIVSIRVDRVIVEIRRLAVQRAPHADPGRRAVVGLVSNASPASFEHADCAREQFST